MNKINLSQKFSLFNDFWCPKIVGELNGSQIKLAKLKGEFDWLITKKTKQKLETI